MNIIEIIERLDKSEGNKDWIDTSKIGQEVGIFDMDYVQQERLTAYWVGSWMCTDTVVGYKVYLLDGEPMAFSTQTARKSDEVFYWLSQEKGESVRSYLLSLKEEEESSQFNLINLEEDLGEGYHIDFSGQLLGLEKTGAKLNGEPVKILERVKHTEYNIDTDLIIERLNGETSRVSIRDLVFDFYLREGEA